MDTKSEIHRMVVGGMTDVAISRELELSRERVRQVRAKLGLPPNKRPPLPKPPPKYIVENCCYCGEKVRMTANRRSHIQRVFCSDKCRGRQFAKDHGIPAHPEHSFHRQWIRVSSVIESTELHMVCPVCGHIGLDSRILQDIWGRGNPPIVQLGWCIRCGTIWADKDTVLRYKQTILKRRTANGD